MRRIFVQNPVPGIPEWIEQNFECYIYEQGHFNDGSPRNGPVIENIELLRRYHQICMDVDKNIADIFESPYGSPRSVRVIGDISLVPGLGNCVSTTLNELDITRCHGDYTEEFRLRLIASAPRLQVLACSLCFFLSDIRGRGTSRGNFTNCKSPIPMVPSQVDRPTQV